MPDVAARLSGLHALLSARLAMHDRLLGLAGRLDLILTQVELRSAARPAPVVPTSTKAGGSKAKANTETTRYVEGESSDEVEQPGYKQSSQVEVEEFDEEGSIEDIEFTAANEGPDGMDEDTNSEISEDAASDDDRESTGTSDDDDLATTFHSAHVNGLVDAGAEEWSESESGSGEYAD
jgi:U3 small nucleolar RNA-associated protein 5